MNEMHHSETGSMAVPADLRPRSPMLWTRLRRAAFLTGISVVVVVSMVGWLGGLAMVVLELCEIFFVS
jgi:hypothetical protein